MIGNSLTEDTGSAQRYHAEDQHEQRNGFTKANHGDILREALAGFRQASAPAAPALPCTTAENAMARLEAIPRLSKNVGSALDDFICCIRRKP